MLLWHYLRISKAWSGTRLLKDKNRDRKRQLSSGVTRALWDAELAATGVVACKWPLCLQVMDDLEHARGRPCIAVDTTVD